MLRQTLPSDFIWREESDHHGGWKKDEFQCIFHKIWAYYKNVFFMIIFLKDKKKGGWEIFVFRNVLSHQRGGESWNSRWVGGEMQEAGVCVCSDVSVDVVFVRGWFTAISWNKRWDLFWTKYDKEYAERKEERHMPKQRQKLERHWKLADHGIGLSGSGLHPCAIQRYWLQQQFQH